MTSLGKRTHHKPNVMLHIIIHIDEHDVEGCPVRDIKQRVSVAINSVRKHVVGWASQHHQVDVFGHVHELFAVIHDHR